MDSKRTCFLTARWLNLAFLNFEIAPGVLARYVPAGTELDAWQGRPLVSLVGFQFRDTRVLGLPIPFHRNFDEVNLRFYVRRKLGSHWRRGVVFVRELAPRRAVAWVARVCFGENYLTVPIHHRVDPDDVQDDAPRRVEYAWTHQGRDYRLHVATQGDPRFAAAGTQESFTTELAWGYSGGPGRRTIEYHVEHPPWRMWSAQSARFEGDATGLYGEAFAEALSAAPASAFVMDGSVVSLSRGMALEQSGRDRPARRRRRRVTA
jgi:uncharacterized protein YqjF (DUF2071 family)